MAEANPDAPMADTAEKTIPEIKSPQLKPQGKARHSEKEKMIHTFHNQVWPALEAIGWKKEENDDGETLFIPQGVDPKNEDECYFSIKSVISRVNERKTPSETAIADAYRREMSRPVKPIDVSEAVARRIYREQTKDPLDLSWKQGGRNFPQRSSNIGENYQVSTLPPAGSFQPDQGRMYELIWDPKKARTLDMDDVMKKVSHHVREEAYPLLRSNDFNVDAFYEAVKLVKPIDGSDWEVEQRSMFAEEIFRARKDMKAVCKAMDIPMKTCLAYYLGQFKASDDYRLLKTVCCQERIERLESLDHGVDACTICGDGGSLLICDGCDKEYHQSCCRPKLAQIPQGDWECDECVATKFLKAKDYLLRTTKLFKRVKRTHDEMESPEDRDELVPVNSALAAAREFAKACCMALSAPLKSGDVGRIETTVKSEA